MRKDSTADRALDYRPLLQCTTAKPEPPPLRFSRCLSLPASLPSTSTISTKCTTAIQTPHTHADTFQARQWAIHLRHSSCLSFLLLIVISQPHGRPGEDDAKAPAQLLP